VCSQKRGTLIHDLNSMTDRQYRAYENKLRRAAKRQGLVLQKARSRDPQYWLTGTYQLVDAEINCVVVSGSQDGYGLSLDEVAEQLEAER